jgi:hypothetical protein
MYRACRGSPALHEQVDVTIDLHLTPYSRLTILSVNQIIIYSITTLYTGTFECELEVIMRLTTWLVSALGVCFLHRPQYRICYPNSVSSPFHTPGVGRGSAGALVNPRSSGFSCHTRPRLDSIPCRLSRYCTVIRIPHMILRRHAN